MKRYVAPALAGWLMGAQIYAPVLALLTACGAKARSIVTRPPPPDTPELAPQGQMSLIVNFRGTAWEHEDFFVCGKPEVPTGYHLSCVSYAYFHGQLQQ